MEKKVIATLDWGLCPKCKDSRLVYFMNTYQAGVPGEGGTYITYILNEDTTVKAICPKCKFQANLIYTINGICSEQHAREHHYINTGSVIQPIEEREITVSINEVTSNDENIEQQCI